MHKTAGLWQGWYAPPEVTTDGSEEIFENGVQHSARGSVIECGEKPQNVSKCYKAPNFCLFNIKDDPCEYHDLSEKHPDILASLVEKLNGYRGSMVPPRNNYTADPLANPKLYNGVWQPWMGPLP